MAGKAEGEGEDGHDYLTGGKATGQAGGGEEGAGEEERRPFAASGGVGSEAS